MILPPPTPPPWPQEPSTANNSQLGVGPCETLCCLSWNFEWLDIVWVLFRQTPLLCDRERNGPAVTRRQQFIVAQALALVLFSPCHLQCSLVSLLGGGAMATVPFLMMLICLCYSDSSLKTQFQAPTLAADELFPAPLPSRLRPPHCLHWNLGLKSLCPCFC